MKTNIRKIVISFVAILAILLLGFLVYYNVMKNTSSNVIIPQEINDYSNVLPDAPDKQAMVTVDETEPVVNTEPIQEVQKSVTQKIVDSVGLKFDAVVDKYVKKADVSYDVPFITQAPFGNWDPPYDEACEEASMIMVDYYLRNLTLNSSIGDQQIIKLINWQAQQGYGIDLTAFQMKTVLKQYMNIDSSLMYEPTKDDIIDSLIKGNLVVLPVAGRLLGNPYFTPPGPLYHVLVVTGYDVSADEFITNDPGTKRGEKYRYKTDTIINAIHDWNGGDVYSGQKVIVIIEK